MKSIIPLSLILIFVSPSYSQRVEIQLSSGYGFENGGSPLSSYDRVDYYSADNSTTTAVKNEQDKYFSFGEGLRFESKMIVYFKDEVGIFIQPSYSSGSQSSETTEAFFFDGLTAPQSTSTKISFSTFSIHIGLHYQKLEGIFQPFGGIGAGYFFPSKPLITQQQTNSNSNIPTYTETRITTNSPLGFLGYLGINFNVKSDLSFFVEAKAALVNFYVKREEITRYLVNGEDQLGSLTTKEKITVYEKNKNYTTISPDDDNSPAYGGPPLPASGSTISITAGISFPL
jgi:hypothetical protein